jgi:hypothetical protein
MISVLLLAGGDTFALFLSSSSLRAESVTMSPPLVRWSADKTITLEFGVPHLKAERRKYLVQTRRRQF